MDLSHLKTIGALVIATQAFAAKSDVTLAWNPVQGTVISNYTVTWGTNSGVYIFEANAGTLTTLTVTNLSPNTAYYLAVYATAQDGSQSPDSNEILYTNSPVAAPPDLPVTNGTAGGGGTNATNSGGAGSGGSGMGNGSIGEVSIPGIPPVLVLSFTNHHTLLAVSGTVGSMLMIQCNTNAANQDTWSTITNLAMTNADAGAQNNQGSPSAINFAFVPAAQNYEVLDTASPVCEFFQAVMPYDYMVLADSVLSGKGYPSRLLLVCMPGIPSEDVCYVTAQNSFIYYDTTNLAFGLESSGSAIRQIANTLSTSLGQNWTSASEFSYSNGVSSILATVVEAEPASSDPVAGASSASIQIDF